MASILRAFTNQLFPNAFNFSIRCRVISKIAKNNYKQVHEKICNNIKQETKMETVKENLDKVNKETSVDQHFKLLRQYIHLAEKDEEIDFISQYLEKKNFLQNDQIPTLKGYLMRHLICMNKYEKIFELNKNANLLYSNSTKNMVLHNLMNEKRFDDLVKLYDSFEQNQKFFCLITFTKALLLQNTMESFEKMKEEMSKIRGTLRYSYSVNVVLNVTLLAINQKQNQFAKEFLDSLNLDESDNIIVQNLQSIVLSNLNELDESLEIIESILEKNDWKMFDLEKKFFKLTLKAFRRSAQNNKEMLQRFETVHDRIINTNQLNSVDLIELAKQYKALKTLDETKLEENQQANLKQNMLRGTNNAKNSSNQIMVVKKIERNSSEQQTQKNDNNEQKKNLKLFQSTETNLQFNQSGEEKSTTTTPKINKILENIKESYKNKKFLSVINLFEENFLRQNQPTAKTNITQAYLHMYAKSLLDLHNEINNKIHTLIQLPMKENLILDEGSKKYLYTLYKELILNKNNLANINLSSEEQNKPKSKILLLAKKQVQTSSDELQNIDQSHESKLEIIHHKGQVDNLFSQKEYQRVIDFFESHFENSNQPIESKYVDYLTFSLYKTNKNIQKTNKFLNLIERSGSPFGPKSILNTFCLNLNQGEPLSALELLISKDSSESFMKAYPTIYHNLLISGFCLVKKLDLALEEVNKIFQIELNDSNEKHAGKIFPLAIKCLKQAVYDADEGSKRKINEICEKAIQEKRVSSEDLPLISL